MPAYIIARVQIQDYSWIWEYSPKTKELIRKHNGKVLTVFGSRKELLEGDQPLPTAIVIVEFPSMEEGRAFYSDPEYAPLIARRQTGAVTDVVLVDGVPEPGVPDAPRTWAGILEAPGTG